MQTAFHEIVFYLNKQPHSHKLQTKMRSGLFAIHFASQGEYANIMRAKKKKKNGYERRNWIKDGMRQDADYETEIEIERDRERDRERGRRFLDKTG